MKSLTELCRALGSALTRSILPLLLLVLLAAGAGWAQEAPEEDAAFAARITAWQATLDRAATAMVRRTMAEQDFEQVRESLTEVFKQARAASAAAGDGADTTRQLVEALGKPPGENDPPEAPAVAADRTRLGDLLRRWEGQMHQADLIATRADILLRTANEQRITQFAEKLFLLGVSPLSPETWKEVPTQAQFLSDRVTRAWALVLESELPWRSRALELGVLLGLGLVVGGLLRHWLLRRHGQRAGIEGEPGYRERVLAAVAEALGRGLIPVLVVLALGMVALETLQGLPLVSVLRAIVRAVAGGLIAYVLARGFCHALLAPSRPRWRLGDFNDDNARRLSGRLSLFLAALALAGAILAFLETALVAPELHAVASFGAKLIGALALLRVVLPSRIWRRHTAAAEAAPGEAVEDAEATGGTIAPTIRLVVGLATLLVVGLALVRFHNLGIYLAQMLVAGAVVIGTLMLLRGIGRELVELFVTSPRGRLAHLRRSVLHSERDLHLFQSLMQVLLDLLLLALGAAALLPVSGIAWSEVRAWIVIFLHGVTIGGVTLAPLDMLTALVLVAAILSITRFLQRKVDEQVLQRLQIDRGVRHSIRTGVGYFGTLIAILTGIATLGLNLNNLALIAGALSVGIGFGLQAVVSNFVAGLILLVERPIKVGDWVVIGEKEGVVKRISVRATEIQTFQHASVIIPNSDLISRAVVNWTYKDKFGRIDIPVGVTPDTDMEKVQSALLECARANPNVARLPAPKVVFRALSGDSFDLELRCFVTDIEIYTVIGTEIRFAIVEAFRANGIMLATSSKSGH